MSKMTSSIIENKVNILFGEMSHRWALREIMMNPVNGRKKVTFCPFHQNFDEKIEMTMCCNILSFIDWILLQLHIEKVNEEEYEPEWGTFTVLPLMRVEELDDLHLPYCSPWGEISSTESIRGNCYNSNADVNGSLMGAKAYSVYFFYIEDLDRYGVIINDYYEM
jgi:hypothetical protein